MPWAILFAFGGLLAAALAFSGPAPLNAPQISRQILVDVAEAALRGDSQAIRNQAAAVRVAFPVLAFQADMLDSVADGIDRGDTVALRLLAQSLRGVLPEHADRLEAAAGELDRRNKGASS